jgi:hypothetical protein
MSVSVRFRPPAPKKIKGLVSIGFPLFYFSLPCFWVVPFFCAHAALARSFNPRASITLRTVSSPGFRSPFDIFDLDQQAQVGLSEAQPNLFFLLTWQLNTHLLLEKYYFKRL